MPVKKLCNIVDAGTVRVSIIPLLGVRTNFTFWLY